MDSFWFSLFNQDIGLFNKDIGSIVLTKILASF